MAVTAFVTEMLGLSPEDYVAMTGANHGWDNAAAAAPESKPPEESATS